MREGGRETGGESVGRADVCCLVFAGDTQVYPTSDGHEGDAQLYRGSQEVIPQRGKPSLGKAWEWNGVMSKFAIKGSVVPLIFF